MTTADYIVDETEGRIYDEDDIAASGPPPSGIDITDDVWPAPSLWAAEWQTEENEERGGPVVYIGIYRSVAEAGARAQCEVRGYDPGAGTIVLHRLIGGSRNVRTGHETE